MCGCLAMFNNILIQIKRRFTETTIYTAKTIKDPVGDVEINIQQYLARRNIIYCHLTKNNERVSKGIKDFQSVRGGGE